MTDQMDANRLYFLEVMYGFVHKIVHAKTESEKEWSVDTLRRFVKGIEEHNDIKPDVRDFAEFELMTVLTYKEAVAIHSALEHAHRAERARIDALAIPHEQPLTRSVLYDRLSTAKEIMDVRRERAEEMGG